MKFRGRYEIKAKIGEGGMGVVFRAYDPPPMDRDVAIKTLPEFADSVALELFYKECNVLKSISHPNIVEIFDMGQFDDAGKNNPFFVMPLLQGQTLDDIIKNAPHRLTVARVVEIISQTCRGLQAAHDRGLIHRDVKPSNLFIIGDDSVKIIDFGVVHAVDSRTRTGSFGKGTLLYMSPEQVTNKPVTPQSDIFSLGIVCYEALTKRHPFRGSTDEIVEAIRRLNPPPASSLNDTVSPLISRVVHKAMAKQQLNRYDSVKEFGENLLRAHNNLPIEIFDSARIQPRIDRARKAIESGDFQFASDIIGELEAAGHLDAQITDLRADIERFERLRTVAQLLENAQARYEDEEDPLALQKIHEVLQIDLGNVKALRLKAKIEERRSERQVDQWMRLARQHIENHSYSHARDALQNVFALRPTESSALRLAKELEGEEQDYLRLRHEKAELYESAVNAWKNGDVSQALSNMRLVLDLDRRAPDMSTPETSAPYQSFYNKIRSEHEALNAGYAEARRHLAEQNFTKALEICQEFLAKYPGQPLFQALKFDVEEQHRQRLSSYIADVNRRLEAESDLDAKVSLVREAVARYPGEPHFERLLKLMQEKRDLVRSIVARAEGHEGRGQINEALSDFETLSNIYPSYPGLQYEIERLQKRRDQMARAAARTDWIRKIDRQLESGNYAKANELIGKTEIEYPSDPELVELRKLSERGLSRAHEAERLFGEGQRLCTEGCLDDGIVALRDAHRLDDRNPVIRAALRDALIEKARANIETNWHAAEPFIDEALGLDTQHPVAKSLRAQLSDRKRDEVIAECAAKARRLQAGHELDQAEFELKRVLADYPGDPRLTAILDTISKELGHSIVQQARAIDLAQLRGFRERAEGANDRAELEEILTQTRQVTDRYPAEPNRAELETISHEIERNLQDRGARSSGGDGRASEERAREDLKERSPDQGVQKHSGSSGFSGNKLVWSWVAALLVTAIGIGALAKITVGRRPGKPRADTTGPLAQATLHVRVTPAGAKLTVDGRAQDGSEAQLALDSGEHTLEATLLGYAPLTKTMTLDAGRSSDVELPLQPLADSIRLVTPDVEAGDVWLDDTPVKAEGGSLTYNLGTPGAHVLRISTPKVASQEAKITFTTAVATLPVVATIEVPDRQAVVVSSLGGSAQIRSSLGTVGVRIDDQPQHTLTPDGLSINNLTPGLHELTIGEGKNLRRMSFAVGSGPALDAIVYSDLDVGSVLVSTGESDVTVQLDGVDYPRKTVNGLLRLLSLPSRQHTIRVRKEGFTDPDMQTVTVAKGQETSVRFELRALQRAARLDIQRGTPGTQVWLDENTTAIGTINSDGTFSRAVPPGSHVLRLTLDGYQPKRLTRDFVGGETVSLSAADLELQGLPAIIDITSDSLEVTVTKDGQVVRQFKGSAKVSVLQGTYTVSARNSSGMNATRVVSVGPGETNPLIMSINGAGMDGFEHPNEWSQDGTWYTRKGGNFVLYRPRPMGRITFTLRPRRKGRLFIPGQRIRWVVGYVDPKNYMLVELDSKYLYRSEYFQGTRHEMPRVEHHVSWNDPFFSITMEVSDDVLIHQFRGEKGEWKELDTWDRRLAGSASSKRTFADGKFGFYLPQDEEVEISNFSFAQAASR